MAGPLLAALSFSVSASVSVNVSVSCLQAMRVCVCVGVWVLVPLVARSRGGMGWLQTPYDDGTPYDGGSAGLATGQVGSGAGPVGR